MPLTPDSMIRSVPSTKLTDGTQTSAWEPHPMLQSLQAACQTGGSADVETLLREVVPLPDLDMIPKAVLPCLWQAVVNAAQNPDHGVLEALFRNGFRPYKLSWQAVDTAFKQGDTNTLELLIKSGWDVNEAGPDLAMRPLLRHAVNKPEMRKFLLTQGADSHIENNRRLTPLETAAGWSQTEVVEELIKLGNGDPRRDDSLLAAVAAGRLDNAKVLVAHGANVDQLEKEYHPPFNQKPRRTPLDAAYLARRDDLVDWLKEKGANARHVT